MQGTKRKIRICLVSTGQPSNNPRLVKEADALAEAGYMVHAICCDCGLWPSLMDAELMERRNWTCQYAIRAGDRKLPDLLRLLRYKAADHVRRRLPGKFPVPQSAIPPAGRALRKAAAAFPADLYIAHHPFALPAAVDAAIKFGAGAGYDAEDLHSGMRLYSDGGGYSDAAAESIEKNYLRSCKYVTTAAPGFTLTYARDYQIADPVTILNVFPLSERPSAPGCGEKGKPLRLYWFSQCIGDNRGLEDAVRAIGLLHDLPIELHLRGEWQPGYQASLFGLAARSGMDTSRIEIHPPAPPAQMVSLAAEYDVGLALEQPVNENRDLCLSNKFFVYLLAGNALAVTGSKGQRPFAHALENAAFIYTPGDIEGLASGLRNWCTNRVSLQAARETSWRLGTERFNWDLEKLKLLDIVASVVPRNDPGMSSEETRQYGSETTIVTSSSRVTAE